MLVHSDQCAGAVRPGCACGSACPCQWSCDDMWYYYPLIRYTVPVRIFDFTAAVCVAALRVYRLPFGSFSDQVIR